MVLQRRVEVPSFDQRRTRQRRAFQSRNAEQENNPMAFAAYRGFDRKIELRLPWHLHSKLQFLAGFLDRVIDRRRRSLRVRLGIPRRELPGSNALPGPRHVCA